MLLMLLNLVRLITTQFPFKPNYFVNSSNFQFSDNDEAAIEGIQALAQSNNLNIVDNLGYTLLHWCALRGTFHQLSTT